MEVGAEESQPRREAAGVADGDCIWNSVSRGWRHSARFITMYLYVPDMIGIIHEGVRCSVEKIRWVRLSEVSFEEWSWRVR